MESLLSLLGTIDAAVVIPHLLPDLDALASAEGLCRILRARGVEAWALVPELPAIYSWAIDPGIRITAAESDLPRIAVDTARPDRLQVPGPVQACIDHHEDNPLFGQVNWVQVAPSCTCLLGQLAQALGVELGPELATVLYRGLVGDTEGFAVNVGPEAFGWAARFCAAGADTEGTAEGFRRRSPGFWDYLAAVERSSEVLPGPVPLRIVPVPKGLPDRMGLLPYENALLPHHLIPPRDGILAILQEGAFGVRFRLRSHQVDLLPLAHRLGGGGHPHAAGVLRRGQGLPEAIAALRQAWAEEQPSGM